jgi:opacity protein-like surface antigen
MMKTLLFATAAVTALAVAAPADARHFRGYGYYGYYGEYGGGYTMRHRIYGCYHGYVECDWASHCGQLQKAC